MQCYGPGTRSRSSAFARGDLDIERHAAAVTPYCFWLPYRLRVACAIDPLFFGASTIQKDKEAEKTFDRTPAGIDVHARLVAMPRSA
jgi:hypothetical protein